MLPSVDTDVIYNITVWRCQTLIAILLLHNSPPFIMTMFPLWHVIDCFNGFYRLFIILLQKWINTTSLHAWLDQAPDICHGEYWSVFQNGHSCHCVQLVTHRNCQDCLSLPDVLTVHVGALLANNALYCNWSVRWSPVACCLPEAVNVFGSFGFAIRNSYSQSLSGLLQLI